MTTYAEMLAKRQGKTTAEVAESAKPADATLTYQQMLDLRNSLTGGLTAPPPEQISSGMIFDTPAPQPARSIEDYLLGADQEALPPLHLAPQLPDNFTDAALRGAADMGLWGAADSIIAGIEAVPRALVEGGSVAATYERRKAEINAQLEKDRTNHPGGNLVGSILGGMATAFIPGAAVDKTARGTGWMVRTFGITAPVAAGEAALYRYNSDGTKEEIQQDALLGGLAASVFGTAGSLVGGKVKNAILSLLKRDAWTSEKLAAQSLLDAINMKSAKEGLPELNAGELTQILKDRGVEAVIGDFFPDMAPLINTAMKTPGTEGQEKLLALLAARTNLETTTANALSEALLTPQARSLKGFEKFVEAQRKATSPEYDTIFARANAAGVKFEPKAMLKSLEEALLSNDKLDIGQSRAAIKALKKLMKDRTVDGAINMRGLHTVKSKLYDATGGSNPSAEKAKGILATWLGDIDDTYAAVTNKVADKHTAKAAYSAGYSAFGGKSSDSFDIIEALARYDDEGATTAFISGMRRKLVEELKGKNSKAMTTWFENNTDKVDILKAALGEDETNQLLGKVVAEIQMGDMVAAVKAGKKTAAALPQEGDKGLVSNLAVAMAASGNSPGRIRAAVGAALPGSKPNAEVMGNRIGEVATTPLEELPTVLRELSKTAERGPATSMNARASMLGGGTAGLAVAGEEDAKAQYNELMPQLPNIMDLLRQSPR